MTQRKPGNHRIERRSSPSGGTQVTEPLQHRGEPVEEDAVVDCGWGRLIFAHTFADIGRLVKTVRAERKGRRDLALYLRDPHVVLAQAPQELFLDPSHTFRLWLSNYLPGRIQPNGFDIRRLQTETDAEDIQRLLLSRNMVAPEPDFIWDQRRSRELTWFIAVDSDTDRAIGTVQGVDHKRAFNDPENGSSMWCLAVDPQARQPGIGRCLVARIADHYAARGRAFMDLSVMHDNDAVIRLYEKMGFVRIPAFSVKTKSAINEPLFTGPRPDTGLNPYARIIIDEARRRGVGVDILDAEHGYFQLSLGGRSIICRESLTELTTAIALSRCDNKRVTYRVVEQAGITVPRQQPAGEPDENHAFLRDCGRLVVKPARGEQGNGVSVNLSTPGELDAAVESARQACDEVLLEEYRKGRDLRVIVIDYRVVAAAIRLPPNVTGNGQLTIRELIDKQSRRRAAATDGESRIPQDAETERCVANAGYALDDVLEDGAVVDVRETANLHTGGTLHDVTDELSPTLRDVSIRCAKSLDMPVVGLDFIVPAAGSEDYVFIEANERPGLANHEPQPTAERFLDFLFPQTAVKLAEE
ncbi:N-acetylglutaminylglutamine synthetase [Elongatibacter sediminis]|uniref:N-acetylglutaminylglutamine synthetase n=1 Tax=Elongatibacter sediminis TaxID=3119006 RepID=A0AAW9RAG8_9GAMM